MQRVWSTYLDSNGQQIERQRGDSPHLMDPNSPRSSITSHANSSYSATGSTRHILSHSDTTPLPMSQSYPSVSDYGGLLQPPMAPFASSSSSGPRGSRDNLSVGSASNSNLSLSVNYIPSKFSSSILAPAGARNRKGKKGAQPNLTKRGGGLDAFRSGESRMQGGNGKRLRWNKFKWILIATNSLLLIYSLAALVVCLLTWFDVFTHASILRTGNRPELILSTIAASAGTLTSLVGWAGILLNNRGFLAWYTFLTWVTFGLLVIPGYIAYKKRTFNLEGKVNAQWSRALGAQGRATVQNELACCGYFSPFVEATISQTCYARSVLPGCKAPYLAFERFVLKRWYAASFLLVPFQIAAMLAGLMCSNHVTYRFGKGMMPEAYRLNLGTMAVIMENYANQLADEYGADIADEILKRAQSNTLTSNPNANANANESTTSIPTHSFTHLGDAGANFNSGGYSSGNSKSGNNQTHPAISPFHAKYNSLGNRPPYEGAI